MSTNNGPLKKQNTNSDAQAETQLLTPTWMNVNEAVKLLTDLVAKNRFDLFFEIIKLMSFTEIFMLSEALRLTKDFQTLAMLRSNKGGLWCYYLTELHKMDTSVPLKPPADIQDHKKDCWHYHAVMQASHAIYQRQKEEIADLKKILQMPHMEERCREIDNQDVNPREVTLELLKARHQELDTSNESLIRQKIDLQSNILCLCGVGITRIPKALFEDQSLTTYWRNLVTFDCRFNEIQELPDSLGNLVALENLYCYSNQLKKLPETLGKLASLKILSCSFNRLKQLPASLGDLVSLKILSCSYNVLQQLPATLGNLRSLELINCSENLLLQLPDTLGNIVSLRTLDCEGNRIQQLPTNLRHRFGQNWCNRILANQKRQIPQFEMLPLYAAATTTKHTEHPSGSPASKEKANCDKAKRPKP